MYVVRDAMTCCMLQVVLIKMLGLRARKTFIIWLFARDELVGGVGQTNLMLPYFVFLVWVQG